MAINATQRSANTQWIGISSSNATLITAIEEVLDEAEGQGVTADKAMITMDWDGSKHSVLLIAKKS